MNAKPNVVLPFRVFGLSALCLLLSAVPSAARSPAAIRAFNDAVKSFNAKQFNEAIPKFDDAISADADFAEAYFARGACKYYLKSLDGALLDISDALRLKPDYLEARALRGAIQYEADRWDAALDDFNYVLDKDPKDAQSLLGRAVILLKREDMAGAARDFRAFLRVRPDDPLAPKVRQLLASLKQGPESAPAATQAAAPENPSSTPAPTSRKPTARRPALSAEDIQRLADSLLGHSMSGGYDRKVLRGEKAEATGDIHAVPGIPTDRQNTDAAPQIVDPR